MWRTRLVFCSLQQGARLRIIQILRGRLQKEPEHTPLFSHLCDGDVTVLSSQRYYEDEMCKSS